MSQSQLPPFAQATAGAVGSAVSNAIVYPLDLLSTRLQTQSPSQSPSPSPSSSSSSGSQGKRRDAGLTGAARAVVDRDGVRALYRGLGSDTLSTIASNFLYFYFYSFLRQLVARRKQTRTRTRAGAAASSSPSKSGPATSLSAPEELAVGALAGVISRFFTTPLSNIVVRKQTAASSPSQRPAAPSQPSSDTAVTLPHQEEDSDEDDDGYAKTRTTREIVEDIVNEKGWTGLWSGFQSAILLSSSPALTFYLTKAFTRALVPWKDREKPSVAQTFVTSALANAVATAIVFPLILSKTRLQWKSPSGRRFYRSMTDVVHKTLHRYGVKGLYQGLDGQLIKGLVGHGITMVTKDGVERWIVFLYRLVYLRSAR